MTLSEILKQLLGGWNERIEYRERVYSHTEECAAKGWGTMGPDGRSVHDHPFCPMTLERRTAVRPQQSILAQLADSRWERPVVARDPGGSGGKPKSRMPGNLGDPDEIMTSLSVAAACICCDWGLRPSGNATRQLLAAVAAAESYAGADARAAAQRALQGPWRRSRVMLGYEGVWDVLSATCETCHSPLRVERGHPTSVECTGCDLRIHWTTWIQRKPLAQGGGTLGG